MTTIETKKENYVSFSVLFLSNVYLVFIETPRLMTLRENQIVIVQILYLQADVFKWFHAERLLYECGVGGLTIDRRTLDEQTVARMLELSIDK